MRTRLIVGLLGLSVLASCTDSKVGLEPVRQGSLNAISEARFGGNADFFFAEPLATAPQAGDLNFDVGGANAELVPYARICETDGASSAAGCLNDVTLAITGSAAGAPMTPTNNGEFYIGSIRTALLDPARDYRIEVWGMALSSPSQRATLDARWMFGYRDVRHSATPATCTGVEAFCLITFGPTLPLKVRVEQFAFCPESRNCATQFVTPGQDAALKATLPAGSGAPDAVLFIPAQDGTGFAISFEPCTSAEDAAVSNSLDIPTFGPCLKTVTTYTQQLQVPAIVSLCEELDASSFGLSHEQQQQLALHHLTSDLSLATALPEAFNCSEPTAGVVQPRGLERLALLARSKLHALVSPKTLYAAPIDRGGGGMTSFVASFFKLALPAKFEYVNAGGGSLTTLAGSTVTLSARVTDLFGAPVRNARVRWSVQSSPNPAGSVTSSTPVLTDAAGLAQATVQLSSTAGTTLVHASGRGIAANGAAECAAPSGSTSSCNGPRSTFDPFIPMHSPEFDPPAAELPIDIAEGTRLPFSIDTCPLGFGTATVDGSFSSAEWVCARSYSFTANVSGGSTAATLLVMNDGSRLYLAVRVKRSATDRVNRLQFNFDNDNDGTSETGDDVLSLDAVTGLTDAFLAAKCTNSSQSSCWSTDVSNGGSNNGNGAVANDGEYTTYELSKPLNSGDVGHDFALSAGAHVGLFLTLQTGGGAAGNTQWPGFRQYLSVRIE